MSFRIDIESATLKNNKFRKILYTNSDLQLVVMSLEPYEEIGMEKHDGTQFIRVESGKGRAIISDKLHILRDGVSIIISPNSKHNIIAGDKGMKLYTIYSPPQH